MPPAVLCGLLLLHILDDIIYLHHERATLHMLPNTFPSSCTFSVSCGFLRGDSEDMVAGACSPCSVAGLCDVLQTMAQGDHTAAYPPSQTWS